MKLSKKIVPRAIYFGIGSFATIYLIFAVFGINFGGQAMGSQFNFQILLFPLSGYIAGRIAKRSGWLNGLIVGIPLPLVMALGYWLVTLQAILVVEMFYSLGIAWLIKSVALCTLGGVIADVHLRFSKTNL